ncbi:hypothetical protein [Spongiactinospora sp. 9N601]
MTRLISEGDSLFAIISQTVVSAHAGEQLLPWWAAHNREAGCGPSSSRR